MTGPVQRSPGPSPTASGMGDASRNARWTAVRPSRSGAACIDPRSGALVVTSAASALMSTRASARSASRGVPSSSVASPQATAAAVIRCIATVSTTSTAGTSAISGIWSADGGGTWEEPEDRASLTAATLSPLRSWAQPGIAQAEPDSHLTSSGRSGPTHSRRKLTRLCLSRTSACAAAEVSSFLRSRQTAAPTGAAVSFVSKEAPSASKPGSTTGSASPRFASSDPTVSK